MTNQRLMTFFWTEIMRALQLITLKTKALRPGPKPRLQDQERGWSEIRPVIRPKSQVTS